jgi:hypothetical protein
VASRTGPYGEPKVLAVRESRTASRDSQYCLAVQHFLKLYDSRTYLCYFMSLNEDFNIINDAELGFFVRSDYLIYSMCYSFISFTPLKENDTSTNTKVNH